MNSTQSTNHFFYLAPIRGITDALFRNIYHKHFPYFDAAIAPFINPQRFAGFKSKNLIDILPENNDQLPVVPQLLYNNAEDFIHLGKQLEDLGYSHINWNLGCPVPMVANKLRGSGLLPYTDRIIEILDTVLPSLDAKISIKTRLGFKDPEDIKRLLPLLEGMPLKEITIHPRIGKQLYRGQANLDEFGRCSTFTSHKLIYNGDICTNLDFGKVSERFPDIKCWMIGRGALADPFLLADIKGKTFTSQEKTEKLLEFHNDIYDQLHAKLSGPGHLLGRLKQIWAYLIESFPEKQKVIKKIRKSSSERKYQDAISEIFET